MIESGKLVASPYIISHHADLCRLLSQVSNPNVHSRKSGQVINIVFSMSCPHVPTGVSRRINISVKTQGRQSSHHPREIFLVPRHRRGPRPGRRSWTGCAKGEGASWHGIFPSSRERFEGKDYFYHFYYGLTICVGPHKQLVTCCTTKSRGRLFLCQQKFSRFNISYNIWQGVSSWISCSCCNCCKHSSICRLWY